MSEDEVARLCDAAVNVPFPPLPEPPLVSERLAREVRLNVEAYRDALLRAALSGVPEGAARDADQARLRREMRACLEIAREWMRLDATRDQT